MAPPAATFEVPPASPGLGNGNDLYAKKIALANSVTSDRQLDAKKLAGVEADWESFTFAPIRESQVSRAMSMNGLPSTLLNTYNIISSALLC